MSEYRTVAEIEALKSAWLTDGNGDIEDTEGFELYYHELQQWRIAQNAAWFARGLAEEAKRAATLGFTPQQMEYLDRLEWRIQVLQAELARAREDR